MVISIRFKTISFDITARSQNQWIRESENTGKDCCQT